MTFFEGLTERRFLIASDHVLVGGDEQNFGVTKPRHCAHAGRQQTAALNAVFVFICVPFAPFDFHLVLTSSGAEPKKLAGGVIDK